MSKLVLKNIKKSFNQTHVIKDVSLTIEDGEFVVFVGGSGCGKSTLLRCISGLEDITSGELSFDGEDVTGWSPSERGIGMVFQSYALYPHMTVRENIEFGLKQNKVDQSIIDSRVQSAVEMLELSNLVDRKPKELSGGQRQRVAIGRAIVKEPRVFLFDEPLSNLDAKLRVDMRMAIANLHKRLKSTVIYVTHDQVEAMTLADKIVVLNNGEVSQYGTPMELYHHPKNMFVAQFIGSPMMNCIDGFIVGSDTSNPVIELGDSSKLMVPFNTSSVPVDTPITWGIRPEHIKFVATKDEAIITGKIEVIEKLGNETLVHVRSAASKDMIVVRTVESFTKSAGEIVYLAAEHQHHHLFCNEKALPRTVNTDNVKG